MAIFKRQDVIEAYVASSPAWALVFREVDTYVIGSRDGGSGARIQIRSAERFHSVIFQLYLGTRFSLERTPHMIFGRLMMRSRELIWPAWVADIGESMEAKVFLAARVPRAALDHALFEEICREMRDEAWGFEKELRDKLDWMRGWTPPQPQGGSGPPARRDGTGIVWREG